MSSASRIGRALLLALCLGACTATTEPPAAELESDDAGVSQDFAVEHDALWTRCRMGSEPFAQDVLMREVALYQVVKVPLVHDGTWQSERAAPVVQGKDALLRVFVEPLPERGTRPLGAELTLDNAGKRTVLRAKLNPNGASTEAALGSTLNLRIPGSLIGASTRFAVKVFDPTCSDKLGLAADVRFPMQGMKSLDATHVGKLRVALVPIVVNGVLPDTSATQLEKLRAALLARYPVPAVELSTHAPVSTNLAVQSNGAGWNDVLELVRSLRQGEAPASDLYYYGLVAPNATFQGYCSFGCVAGLGYLNTVPSASLQVAVGVGYPEEITQSTMALELGHAHGRQTVSAPCAPMSGGDPRYPYADGTTGVWGWDNRSGQLIAPTAKDMMTYCSPLGVSNYTYAGLAARSQLVNTSP